MDRAVTPTNDLPSRLQTTWKNSQPTTNRISSHHLSPLHTTPTCHHTGNTVNAVDLDTPLRTASSSPSCCTFHPTLSAQTVPLAQLDVNLGACS